jgi:hypothetical protein
MGILEARVGAPWAGCRSGEALSVASGTTTGSLLGVAGMARSGDDDLELPNAIAAEVDRRLRARTANGDDTVPKPDYVYAVAYEGGITNGVYTRSKARAHAAWEASTPGVRARSRVKRFEVREGPVAVGGQ